MKRARIPLAILVAVASMGLTLLSARGAAFTYQGRLTENGAVANGVYDLRFRLAADGLGNNYIGNAFVTNGVAVAGGVFTVMLDFDSDALATSNLWLQVDVRTNGAGGSYTTLTPLQALTPTPYALMAGSASNLRLSGELIVSGLRVTNASSFSGDATFSNAVTVHSNLTVLGTVAMKGGVVYVPAGREITNVFKNLSNDMHIVLLAGTNMVSTHQHDVGLPHLTINQKTNITIEGLGWQSVVGTGQTGSVFGVFGCSNITFRNFAVIGTRGPIGHDFGSQFGAFDVRGTNFGLVWDGMLIKDHHDLGITQLSMPRDAYDCVVRNCVFDNIGSTNAFYPTLPSDGAAIVVLGSRMKIVNNYFYNCHIAVEFEGAPGGLDGGVRDVLVDGNHIFNTLGNYAIGSYGLGNSAGWENMVITRNIIHHDKGKYWPGLTGSNDKGIAISFWGGQRGTIANNIIKNAHYGITIAALSDARMDDWIISGNTIVGVGKTTGGVGIQITGHRLGTRGFLVQGNTIRDCGAHGIWVGGIHHLVTGNRISHCGTNDGNAGAITLSGYDGLGSCSNFITGNFVEDGSATSGYFHSYAVRIMGYATNNIIQGNWLLGYGVAPYSDDGLGVGNLLLDNIIRTNRAVWGQVLEATFTTNCTQGMTIGAPQSLRMRLTAFSPVTLSPTTSIGNGYYDGQELALVGTSDINTVELPDNSNVQLNGGTSKVLGRGDVLRLVWDAALGDWLQVAPLSDN